MACTEGVHPVAARQRVAKADGAASPPYLIVDDKGIQADHTQPQAHRQRQDDDNYLQARHLPHLTLFDRHLGQTTVKKVETQDDNADTDQEK